ncbi:hypothetical protein ANCDUO_00380 [Ancylostoma duodenale]|uniref:Uncharacterized protein n=1 Tax=Ancylostoma duodenale TaxID=51022 RepID=A0A0C2DH53_9BILA|nr:hypothetical protein ANCDUO_00380 [Ancylostoma duodenale]
MTSDSENDNGRAPEISRSVRFAEHREVRRMPSVEAQEARQARLPYSPPLIDCSFSLRLPDHIKYTLFFFAPMMSAVSYALYITLYTRYQERKGEICINLMFGR